jgi:hypothetical protein
MPVAGFEVYDKVRSIAQQFGPKDFPSTTWMLDLRAWTLLATRACS